jgi:hypothetical protein
MFRSTDYTATNKRLIGRLSAAAIALLAIAASPAMGQGPTPKATVFLPVQGEAPAKLYVDPPIPGPLERAVAIIPYRLENFRILPVFGAAAVNVSPRAGHLHITVDDLPWHWADAGNTDSVVVADLAPGRHGVLIELATPEHEVIASQRVEFTVPATDRRLKAGH